MFLPNVFLGYLAMKPKALCGLLFSMTTSHSSRPATSRSAGSDKAGFTSVGRASGDEPSLAPQADVKKNGVPVATAHVSSTGAAGVNGQKGNANSAERSSMDRVWERVQSRLRAELGEDVYSSWFSSAMLERHTDGQIVLSVATRFLKHWIEHNFGTRLLELWAIEGQGVNQEVDRISILVRTGAARRVSQIGDGQQSAQASAANANRSANPAGRNASTLGAGGTQRSFTSSVSRPAGSPSATSTKLASDGSNASTTASGASGTPLDQRYTFGAFAVGDSNQFAYRAAQELARERSVLGCKVLFLRGGVGLGKTHLCQAIAAELHASGHRTLYLTAEKFMRDFVISLRARAAVDYKEALGAIDVLVVDDIQFLSGQTIQGEFCHVINTLIDSGKTLVVAADRAPAALDSIDARMQSRLSSGLVVEIATMDRTVRRALLERRRAAYKTEGGQADVSDAVLDKVADLITTNGRDLDGAFNRIIAEIGLNNAPVNEQTVASCIGFLLSSSEQPRVKIEDIQRATALQFGLTKTDLLSQRRTKQIVGPRQIAMYLSKTMTVRSLPDIGRRFGGRDHTTVLHAVRKIERELQNDASLQKTVEALKSAILSQS